MKVSIKNAFKRFGFLGFLENVFIHLLEKIGIKFSIMGLYSYDIFASNSNEFLNVFRVTPNAFISQKELNPNWFSDQKVSDMLLASDDENNVALGVFDGKLLVSYGWVSTRTLGLDNLLLHESDGYLWDDYTHPDYRGKGFHSIINKSRIALLFEKGKKRALTQVAHYNRASRVGYIRNGFKLESWFVIFKIGRFERCSLKY